jgi:hypothetical protein
LDNCQKGAEDLSTAVMPTIRLAENAYKIDMK